MWFSHMKKIAFVLLALIIIASPELATAGNQNSFFLGDDAALAAGAIGAITRDSEAIWYNPAGLGGNDRTRLSVSGTTFMLRMQTVDNGVQTTLPSGVYKQNLSGNEYLAVPSALTFATDINSDISIGFGVYMPQYSDFSFNNSLNKTENFTSLPGTVNFSQGFDLDTLATEYDIGGAFGWQLAENFRVGAGLFVVYERTRFNQNLFEDIESADGSGAVTQFYVSNDRILVSTLGTRATLGAQFDPVEDWHIGLTLFSPTFQIYSWGQYSSDHAISGVDASGLPVTTAGRTASTISEWEGDMVEPFHSQISIAWEQPDLWIGLSGDIYLPLKNSGLFIDKKLTWNIAAGSKFKISEKFYGGAGFFTDNSDDKAPSSFGNSQVNYYGITFGTEFRTPIHRESEKPIIFSTVLSGRYALGIGHVGAMICDPDKGQNITNATSTPISVIFNELSLYVGTALYF